MSAIEILVNSMVTEFKTKFGFKLSKEDYEYLKKRLWYLSDMSIITEDQSFNKTQKEKLEGE